MKHAEVKAITAWDGDKQLGLGRRWTIGRLYVQVSLYRHEARLDMSVYRDGLACVGELTAEEMEAALRIRRTLDAWNRGELDELPTEAP